jgi:hypothetical protein
MRWRQWTLSALLASSAAYSQVEVDSQFVAAVSAPAFRQAHPHVVIDEAHFNYHTAGARYGPFAALLRADGYRVTAGNSKFAPASLVGVDLLVIANARGGDLPETVAKPAFASSECDTLAHWVKNGGRLLLVADHAPFGAAANILGERFGVQMGRGHVFDTEHSTGDATILVFSRENRLLANHSILNGRNDGERVTQVIAFEGQSLSVPPGATALLRFAMTAREAADEVQLDAREGTSVGGRAQAVALKFGSGRVIVLGEAALLTAQIARVDGTEMRFGMNASGNDDRQFALNLVHWLSGIL